MKNTLVSIIVPVYNVEKYLERCLDSLISQTLKEIEVICINDGSTDSSGQILSRYAQKDNRIRVINQENAGLSAARNTGLNVAKGEFIGFVDSDDWIDKDFYEKLYNAAITNDCDIAVAGILKHYKQRTAFEFKISQEKIARNLAEKFKISDVPDSAYVWNKIYKAERIKSLNLKFPVGKYYEDQYFTPQVFLNSGNLIVIPDVVYHYWRHSESIVKCTKKNQRLKQDSKDAFEFMENFIKQYNIDTSHCRKVKKYKFLGLTLMKSITKSNKKTNILLNCIKWNAA